MKLFRTLCVLGLTLCLATSVYAGTQSVKISGDLTMRAFGRGDYDLNKGHAESPLDVSSTTNTSDPQSGTSDWENWYMSTAELQVDADMTDNVSAVIRLFNQRDWDTRTTTGGNTLPENVNLSSFYTADTDEFDIGVDLAYVELKEFLYSPLTIKVGRQDLWFGKGFIVGANLQDYNANIAANEYTAVSSFDAIKATLDYDPWTIDLVGAMIWENQIGSKDNETLSGVNIGYVFDVYNAEAEAYWFHKDDRSTVPPRQAKQHNTVHTIGFRGSADPIENWTVAAEGAFQFGHFVGFRDQLEKRGRSAYAIDTSVECRHFKDQYSWKPVVGAEYILYSGDNDRRPTASSSGDYEGWDIMYRGKFDTAYREFVGTYNVTHQGWVGRRNNYIVRFTDAAFTNQHQVLVKGSLMPTDSLTLDGRLGFFWQQEFREFLLSELDPGASGPGLGGKVSKRNRFLGTEVDVALTWDYTEDVSFGLLSAWFFPGSFYYDQSDDAATDLVGTMKVSF